MAAIPSEVQFGAEVEALIVAHWCRGQSVDSMIRVLDHLSGSLTEVEAEAALIPLPVPVAVSGAGEPVSPCEGTHTLRAGWRRVTGFFRRIEEMWIGDLIGVVGLFALLWMLSFLSLLE